MTTRFDDLLDAIARKELGIATLSSGARDGIVSHTVTAVTLKRALHRAYLAGADATAARIFRITPNSGDNT
jgi:hypothetical protein